MKSRAWLLPFFALAWGLSAATSEEIWKVYRRGEAARAAELGLAALKDKPEDMELRQVTGRALVDSEQFAVALSHLEKVVQLDTNRSWQSAWALGYAGYAHFGLGDAEKSRKALEDSLAFKATRNVISFAQHGQMLFGFSGVYSNWTAQETAHFQFHFSSATPPAGQTNFAERHEAAFEAINRFFEAKLPKKIDFFVWGTSGEAETAGLGTLGFARPEMGIVHSHWRQTTGHEMTHIISRQALKPVKVTALINEGVAVYFDQTGRNREQTARAALREAKVETLSLVALWAQMRAVDDIVTYPVAGAVIERLRQQGGDDKLRQLLCDQSIESARQIYGAVFDGWLRELESDLLRKE
ncbi:MAG: hypothetical protein WCO56_09205 [Verrucomicrobiota bacterium]